MAGPFSSTGNQASEIPGVQLQGGFKPTPGVADALNAVASVAIPAIKKNHIDNLQEDITGQTDSIKTALLARANPALSQSLFTEEALANPATAAAFAQFNDIAAAVKQGKLPGQFALERLSVIQNDAIAQSPEFEQEIRAAMVAATGQDPNKRLFANLLSDQAATLSPEAKFQQKLSNDARRVGLTVPAFIEANNSILMAQTENAEFNRSKINGTMNLRKVAGAVNNRSGLIMMDTMQLGRSHIQSGGTFTPEFITEMKAAYGQSIVAAQAQIIATAGDFVDPAEITAAIAPLVAMQGQLDKMLDDGSLQALVSNTNALNKSLIVGEAMEFKDFAVAHALGGERGFLEVMKFFEKATNPQTRALLDKLNPKAAGATLLGEITQGVQLVPTPMGVVKQYGQLGTGTAGLATNVINERVIAANVAIQTVGGKEDAHTAAMNDLEGVSPEHAWVAFDNRKTLAAAMQSKALQAKLIPLQANQTAGLSTEYFGLTTLDGFRADKFSIVGGQLTYKLEGPQGQGQRLEIDNEAPAFVKRFNRANKISAMYSGVGILPASRYTNVQDYLKVVVESVPATINGERADAPKTGPRRVVRGADGKLTFE